MFDLIPTIPLQGGRMQRDGCVGQHLPTFRTGQAVKMKNINYYGQKNTVSDEVAEFLEQDRLRESAQ